MYSVNTYFQQIDENVKPPLLERHGYEAALLVPVVKTLVKCSLNKYGVSYLQRRCKHIFNIRVSIEPKQMKGLIHMVFKQ